MRYRIISLLSLLLVYLGMTLTPATQAHTFSSPSAAIAPPPLWTVATDASALRLRVTTAGVQQLTGRDLQAAGWSLDTLTPATIQLWYRGAEQPLMLAGTSDGRLDEHDTVAFVAQLNERRWSRESVYWLSRGRGTGLRGPLALSPGDPITWEEDSRYETRWASPSGDHWFGRELASTSTRNSTSLSLSLPISAPAGSVLELHLAGTTNTSHAVSVVANGRTIGTATWSGQQAHRARLPLPRTILAGPLQLDLSLPPSGTPTSVVLVDRVLFPDLRPAYPATPNTPTVERGAGINALNGPSSTQAGASFLIISHAAFRDTLGPLVAAHEQKGDTVGVVDVQVAYDLWSFGERDPEAIRSFIRAATAAWQPAPRAILLVGAGTTRLRVGRDTQDQTFIPPYLVSADPIRGEVACDTCFTRLDTDNPLADLMPDRPIGRFPVRTVAEAQAMVRKTATAMSAPPSGNWQRQALFLVDNDREPNGVVDPAGSFVDTAEQAARLLPASMQVQRFYFAPDQPTGHGYYQNTAELRCRLMRAIDGGAPTDTACPQLPSSTQPGAALLMYVGHASMWQWAITAPNAPTPYLWYLYDVDSLKNGDRLPILLSMTCLTGDWANPILQTTDERMVVWPSGGAVASLASTGEGVNTAHAQLLHGLLPRLFDTDRSRRSLGEAHLDGLRAVLAANTHVELVFTFGILGDPDVTLPFVATRSLYFPQVVR